MSLPPDRRAVLHGLAGIALATATGARSAVASPSFVALGDWGREGGMRQKDVAVAMARAAAEIGSRFVVSVGDNFYPAGVKSVLDSQWKTSFEDVYSAQSLQTPWYVALGNHDYRGQPAAQVAYSRSNARWRMPSRYYAISGAEVGAPELDIFVTDTTPLLGEQHEAVARLARGRVRMPEAGRQIAWLRAALERSRADWKIVIGHHPIYSGGRHGGSDILAMQLEPLLKAHNVQAYIAGHDHTLQHIRVDATHHICTGAGASAGEVEAVEGTLFHHDEPGFAMFTLDGEALNLEFRDFNGRSLYRAAIPKMALNGPRSRQERSPESEGRRRPGICDQPTLPANHGRRCS